MSRPAKKQATGGVMPRPVLFVLGLLAVLTGGWLLRQLLPGLGLVTTGNGVFTALLLGSGLVYAAGFIAMFWAVAGPLESAK